MAINKQLPTEAGTIGEKTSKLQIYAPPDYSGANVAGLLAASVHIATCCVPACTSQFFERLKPNKPSDQRESCSV